MRPSAFPAVLPAALGTALAALVLACAAPDATARDNGDERPGAAHGRGAERPGYSPRPQGRSDEGWNRSAPQDRGGWGAPGWQHGPDSARPDRHGGPPGLQSRDDDGRRPHRAPDDDRDRDRDGWRERPPHASGGDGGPSWLPPGHTVSRLPPQPLTVWHAGQRYWFSQGLWYAPRASSYVVIRPPLGIVVAELPVFRTIVRLGAVTLYLVNDVYYRPVATGYQVVAPPAQTVGGMPRAMVYPRLGQSPEQQARDEYECHGWAVNRSGWDPAQGAPSRDWLADDYRRALAACLDGRGYSVR